MQLTRSMQEIVVVGHLIFYFKEMHVRKYRGGQKTGNTHTVKHKRKTIFDLKYWLIQNKDSENRIYLLSIFITFYNNICFWCVKKPLPFGV